MKNLWRLLPTVVLFIIISSCNSKEKNRNSTPEIKTLHIAIENAPQTYLLREVNDYYSSIVLSQIAEGLVKLDPKTLNVVPALATSWDVSSDGKTYTFHLRKGVKFHNNKAFANGKGREFTSADVVYTYQLDAQKNGNGTGSHAYNSFLKGTIVGAEAFHTGEAPNIAGIKVIDKYTVSFTLINPDLNFTNKLASIYLAIVAKEVVESGNETNVVGTGPFMFAADIPGAMEQIVLTKNPNYYLKDENGNTLPYLDSIVVYVENNQIKQLSMFEEHKLDFIQNIPPSKITEVLEQRMKDFSGTPPIMKLSNDPLMVTQYYTFNLRTPALKDVRVRKALNYAFNRDKMIFRVLNSRYTAANYGIVPPLPKEFPGYDFKNVEKHSYYYNPDKARKLLAEAGYPGGKGFPSLTLKFNIGTVHSAVADEFRKQMEKELNININLEGLSFEDKINDEQTGNGDLFRTSWFADYKSPETFLINFYGKVVPQDVNEPSKINSSRYVNAKFDALFEQAKAEINTETSNRLFSQAGAIMMDEAPILVMWYGEQYILQYYNVRNLETNAILSLDFTKVRIQDWTKEEYIQSQSVSKK
jgi:ABC-type transport system substrate-binding protein